MRVVAVSAVVVPVQVHREHVRQVAATQKAIEVEQQRHQQEVAKLADAFTDDELLSHVDSDIAQSAPDAMEPLESLMTDKSSQ